MNQKPRGQNEASGPEPDDRSLPPILGEPEREDIDQIHQSILEQEREEPKEGLEPTPWWVWVVSVLVIFAMGFYLGRYGGTFSTQAHELYQRPQAAPTETAAPAPRGDLIYATICLPCHQAGGAGLEGKYPPLAGSEWVAGDAGVPVRIVLNGLRGPVQVSGKTYSDEMPALGGQLNDAEVAAVLSFVRSSWGNSAAPVTPELVGQIRKETRGAGPWTAEALEKLPPAEIKP